MNGILEGISQYIRFRLIGYADNPLCLFFVLIINFTIRFSYLEITEHLVKHIELFLKICQKAFVSTYPYTLSLCSMFISFATYRNVLALKLFLFALPFMDRSQQHATGHHFMHHWCLGLI